MFGTLSFAISPAAASVPLQINFVILVVVLRRICGIKGRVEKMKTKARVRSVDAVGLSVCLSVHLCVLATIQREVHRRRIHRIMLRGAKPTISGRGRGPRGRSPRPRVESGGGALGEGQPVPSPQAGECCTFLQPGVRCESRPRKGFLAF